MSCIRKIQLGENNRATLDFFAYSCGFFVQDICLASFVFSSVFVLQCKAMSCRGVLHLSCSKKPFVVHLSCSARQCRAGCLAFVLQFRKENIMSNNLTFRLDSETERMLNELVTYYLGVGTLGGTNKLSVEEEKALN